MGKRPRPPDHVPGARRPAAAKRGKGELPSRVEWNWLSQLFVAGYLRHGHPSIAFDSFLLRQVTDATTIAGLGGVSEVFDHRGPAGPDFQTWSMTALLESLHRFLGVVVDVPRCRLVISPQKPRRWPWIRARKSYGDRPFDVEYSVRAREQVLSLQFESIPFPEIDLMIALPLEPGWRPRSVTVKTAAGIADVTNTCSEQDCRSAVSLHIQAERSQVICMKVSR